MTKSMLIDATHAEETRVVVLDGNRLEDFDVETSTKRQLKGNIYLAKVVRVEPSLQAAFVEYGGGRHGFLAFGEIHPDYYQIPVADRQRLLELEAEEARHEQEEDDRIAAQEQLTDHSQDAEDASVSSAVEDEPADERAQSESAPAAPAEPGEFTAEGRAEAAEDLEIGEAAPAQPAAIHIDVVREPAEASASAPADASADFPVDFPAEFPADFPVETDEVREIEQTSPVEPNGLASVDAIAAPDAPSPIDDSEPAEAPPPELIGGDHDGTEDQRERRTPPRFTRNYKIQEVIKRRQILLVQVVKEERGTKGAALTTYISLAGRYCVLMPNSPRGGGISRKITSLADRRRLKEATAELDLPKGMGLIVRTAGANRPKPEIKRDCEYLLRLWDDVREHTMRSVAPALIYEEASLIKRCIRDVYSRDIDDLLVDGEDGWRAARDFMRMLMPSHVRKVQLWSESQPLFARFQVDAQLDAMMMPTVQLRSGGYLVINQTEALVAIDVNSGRSTRERGIEETALRTNLEAADEAARQLRLRDLAGLVVIDFIDMESRKNNAAVEKRLKDALKADRARIQMGHISHFGLLEMSRQRLRPSLAETNFIVCPHCGGMGHVRSTESAAIHVLRGIEEEAAKRRSAEVVVHVALPIAMYILNHKRERLSEIEQRHAIRVVFSGDDTLVAPQFRIDRVRAQTAAGTPIAVRPEAGIAVQTAAEREADEIEADPVDLEEDSVPEAAQAAAAQASVPQASAHEETAEEGEQRRKRRRRRRRGGRPQESTDAEPSDAVAEPTAGAATSSLAADPMPHVEGVPEPADPNPAPIASGNEDDRVGRRRGRRGGGRARRAGETLPEVAAPGAEQPDLPPAYIGPTPANPFGGQGFDIFDVLERVETQQVAPVPALPVVEAPEPEAEPVMAAEMPEPMTSPEASAQPVSEPPAAPEKPAPPAEQTASPPADDPVAANDVSPAAPVIAPILVGAEAAPPVERKRGWWRR